MAVEWASGGACSGNVTWPTLDRIVLLGLNQTVNASSLVVQARPPGPRAACAQVHACMRGSVRAARHAAPAWQLQLARISAAMKTQSA